MASVGIGVALVPEPFVHRLPDERLHAVRIVEPALAWDVAVRLRPPRWAWKHPAM
eukprot:gene23836-26971_t